MTRDDAIRTVEVLPPSASGETRVVLRAVAAITFGTIFVIGVHATGGGSQNGRGDLAPFQILFRDTPSAVQRMYREIQEGLIEAENTRAATTRWPTVEALAAQGVPPFAPERPAYDWRLVRDGVFLNYVGVPAAGSDGPAFLALIQEPGPGSGETSAAAPLDEIHHRLTDGTVLHVTVWFRPGVVPPDPPVLIQPFASGWTQVLSGRRGP